MESPKYVKTILLETVIMMALLLVGCAVAAEESKLIKKVCGKAKTPYSDCVMALNRDFRAGSINDLRALAFLSLDMALANSSEAMGFVAGMVQNAQPSLQGVLVSCSGYLFDSFRNFNTAVGDLMVDAMTANYDVFLANDGASNCRRAMKEANVNIPAVSTRCSNVEFFVQICYAATDMLQTTP